MAIAATTQPLAVGDEEGRFEGFSHVDDWVPQRLVTATGSNPPPG